MDASRSNSPSRKSRFRSQSGAAYRPAAQAEDALPEVEGEAPVDAEGEPVVYADEEAGAYAYDETAIPAQEESAHQESATIDPLAAEGSAGEAAFVVEDPAAWAAPEEESLPAGLRLTRSTDDLAVRRRGVSGWMFALTSLLCLALGAAGGYFVRANGTSGTAPAVRPEPVVALAPAVLAAVDAAFAANKQGKYTDARQEFSALADQHPGWLSMRIEAARTTMYERDFEAAERLLATIQRSGPNVDAEFLTALLQMTNEVFDKSDAAFSQAIALDPARGDIFYFWGESLRRQGKPRDAADKFRSALLRNQYETAEGLYQLKLWLSEIQADQEEAKDSNTKIDADLASGHPSGAALFAAAAREIKRGQFKEAGAHIALAQKVMEPAVFRVILHDPTFLQENFRPEFSPFYQP